MKINNDAKKFGIEAITLDVNDYRDEDVSPHDMSGVEVDVTITIAGEQHSVHLQHEGDGILGLASNGSDFDEIYEEALLAMGQDVDEDDDVRDRLSAILTELGFIAAGQEMFDAYFQEDESEIEREIYSPDGALGDVQFRACETTDGKVAIQSWPVTSDGYRTHGIITRDEWENWTESVRHDLGNPARIARLSEVLDGRIDDSRELDESERDIVQRIKASAIEPFEGEGGLQGLWPRK